jgi:hypothetical protein
VSLMSCWGPVTVPKTPASLEPVATGDSQGTGRSSAWFRLTSAVTGRSPLTSSSSDSQPSLCSCSEVTLKNFFKRLRGPGEYCCQRLANDRPSCSDRRGGGGGGGGGTDLDGSSSALGRSPHSGDKEPAWCARKERTSTCTRDWNHAEWPPSPVTTAILHNQYLLISVKYYCVTLHASSSLYTSSAHAHNAYRKCAIKNGLVVLLLDIIQYGPTQVWFSYVLHRVIQTTD